MPPVVVLFYGAFIDSFFPCRGREGSESSTLFLVSLPSAHRYGFSIRNVESRQILVTADGVELVVSAVEETEGAFSALLLFGRSGHEVGDRCVSFTSKAHGCVGTRAATEGFGQRRDCGLARVFEQADLLYLEGC